jgi:hypothetical protein
MYLFDFIGPFCCRLKILSGRLSGSSAAARVRQKRRWAYRNLTIVPCGYGDGNLGGAMHALNAHEPLVAGEPGSERPQGYAAACSSATAAIHC